MSNQQLKDCREYVYREIVSEMMESLKDEKVSANPKPYVDVYKEVLNFLRHHEV